MLIGYERPKMAADVAAQSGISRAGARYIVASPCEPPDKVEPANYKSFKEATLFDPREKSKMGARKILNCTFFIVELVGGNVRSRCRGRLKSTFCQKASRGPS